LEELHIHKWAVKHNMPALTAMLAMSVAVVSCGAYEMTRMLRDGELNRYLPPRPTLRHWLRLYRRHRGIWRGLGDQLGTPFGNGEQALRILGQMRGLNREAKDDPKAVRVGAGLCRPLQLALSRVKSQFGNVWREAKVASGNRQAFAPPEDLAGVLEWIKSALAPAGAIPKEYRSWLVGLSDLLGSPGLETPEILKERIASSVEVQFFTEVLLPCHVMYEMTPLALLKRARRGNIISIERLTRLDAAISHDEKIACWGHDCGPDTRWVREESFGKWMTDGLGGRFSPMGVRETFGALITVIMEKTGGFRFENGKLVVGQMTAREIVELFDAVDADRAALEGQVFEIEGWEGINLESFKKAIQRRRKSWIDGWFVGVDKSRTV
jgi:hypothetical protein